MRRGENGTRGRTKGLNPPREFPSALPPKPVSLPNNAMLTPLYNLAPRNRILRSIGRRIFATLRLPRHIVTLVRAWRLMFSALFTGKKIIIFHFGLPSHLQNVGNIPELLENDSRYLVIRSYEWATSTLNTIMNYRNTEKDTRATSLYNLGGIVVYHMFAHLSVVPICGKPNYYPFGAKKIHFFISMASLEGVYEKTLLNGFDYYYCAGRHHMNELPDWLRRNDQTTGTLIPGGYPKLDRQIRKAAETGKLYPERESRWAETTPYHSGEN